MRPSRHQLPTISVTITSIIQERKPGTRSQHHKAENDHSDEKPWTSNSRMLTQLARLEVVVVVYSAAPPLAPLRSFARRGLGKRVDARRLLLVGLRLLGSTV